MKRIAGFFGNFLGQYFEPGGFEQQGILHHLTGFLREVGRELEIGQNGLVGEVLGVRQRPLGYCGKYWQCFDTSFLLRFYVRKRARGGLATGRDVIKREHLREIA